jgi:hypothetical protein
MGNNDDALLISTFHTLKPVLKKLIIIQHYTNTNKSMSLSFQPHAFSKYGILDDALLVLAALFSPGVKVEGTYNPQHYNSLRPCTI